MAGGGHKSTFTSNKNIILWLLGLTICYQIFYQAFMHRELQRDFLEEECKAPPVGGSFVGGQSPQCAEVQLFRTWEKSEAEWHAALAADTGEEEHLIKDSAPVMHFGEVTEETSGPQQTWSNLSGSALGNSSGNATGLHGTIAAITAAATAAARSTSPDPVSKQDLAMVTNSSEGNWSPVTTWAHGLESLQHQLETHMENLPNMQHKHAHEHQAHLDSLFDNVAASLTNASKPGSNNAMTPWARELVELQKHLDAERQARDAAHHRHESTTSTTTEVSLLERIYRVGHELCATPDHADRPECAQFMTQEHPQSSGTPHRHAKAPWKANLSAEVRAREEKLDEKLAELKHERKVWEDAFIARIAKEGLTPQHEGGEASAGPTRVSALRGGRSYVHWSDVKAWHGPKWWEREEGPSLVTREDAQGVHWGGMIPKVACITAITSGFHAKIQMKYFVNNFHLQSYEGPRQLIFVYHHTDTEAARLVQKYADGVVIRGVAARNDEPFPSTMGLRYGAWITDADVIARWDFEEWHHPNRLSLQVRALALSTRPACLVKPVAAAGSTLAREASIVGEAIWMRRHWRPFASNESELLDGLQASRVVYLRADDLRHEGHGSPGDKQKPPACDRATAMAQAPDPALEEQIGERVGLEMQEKYRTLAEKRKDAGQKLRSLCVEFGAESDAARQERLRTDAEKMAAILGELDKHFTALGSLFGSSP